MKILNKKSIFLNFKILFFSFSFVSVQIFAQENSDNYFSNLKNSKNLAVDILEKVEGKEIANKLLTLNLNDLKNGQKAKVAVLFCDIRNFTSMSEKYPTEKIVEMLNNYFSEVVKIVHENNGIIDQFLGDGFLALFGLFEEEKSLYSKHLNDAVNAAFKIIERTNSIKNPEGLPIKNGIGISFGESIVGIIGAPDRWDYMIIGDTVNVASRLESLTKELNKRLIICPNVYQELDAALKTKFTCLGEHFVKGKTNCLTLYGAE